MVVAGSAYLGAVLTTDHSGSRSIFLPGATTDGHYQIELACQSCHTPFGGVANDACLTCHGEALAVANDSHPRSKFTDPRNADLLTRLDATRCVTCHREHRPAMTRAIGVTLPDDYCYTCHRDIAKDRPSHLDLTFQSCGSAGCHNYHDNTALYEDFLVAHAAEPALRPHPQVPARRRFERRRQTDHESMPARTSLPGDAPPSVKVEPSLLTQWESTTHARSRVNCTGCHSTAGGGPASPGGWISKPTEHECSRCHAGEVDGFFAGKHGMRRARDLTPLTPAMARQPMKSTARERQLSCSSCHSAHAFDTERAGVDACLTCHDDGHSRAYVGSPHYALWIREVAGQAAPGTGVSCATCHLPRLPAIEAPATHDVRVQHNQNSNLRPNEKMVRTVCLDCHGLGFSLDSLADPRLIATNFTGRPLRQIASIEMARRRAGASHINDQHPLEGR
jgi:hypothetical protein